MSRSPVLLRGVALVALHAIGDEEAMQTLRRLVLEEPPGRVRQITVAALNHHYHQH